MSLLDSAQAVDSLIGSVASLVGGSGSQQGSGESSGSSLTKSTQQSTTNNKNVSQLQLDDEAVQQIIRDVLGGADGLASIFAGEQSSGLYNSTVAAQAAGDLAAKLVGEIAKITGKQVDYGVQHSGAKATQGTSQNSQFNNKTKVKDDGLFDSLF